MEPIHNRDASRAATSSPYPLIRKWTQDRSWRDLRRWNTSSAHALSTLPVPVETRWEPWWGKIWTGLSGGLWLRVNRNDCTLILKRPVLCHNSKSRLQMDAEHWKTLIDEIQMCIMDNSLRCHKWRQEIQNDGDDLKILRGKKGNS